MKNYVLLITFIASSLCAQIDYKKTAIEGLKIAQDLVDLPPKGAVRIRTNGHDIIISKETPKLVNKALDREKNLPMHYAAQHGTRKDLALLVNFGASIEKTNNWNQTPLMKAVQGANILTVGFLLENGAQLTQERHPSTSFTPFHYAVESVTNNPTAMVAIINALAQHDPVYQYINMESKRGTPLELAIRNNSSPDIIKALLRNGAKVTKQARELSKKNPAIMGILEVNEQPITPGV